MTHEEIGKASMWVTHALLFKNIVRQNVSTDKVLTVK